MVERAKKGKQASVDGFAHEHIVMGILMKKYQNVSLVSLPHSPYDIIIVRKDTEGNEDVVRAQVKTATKSISFRGGGRGGVDRKYISKQNSCICALAKIFVPWFAFLLQKEHEFSKIGRSCINVY